MAYITTSDLSARLGTTVYGRLTDRVDGKTADAGVAAEIVAQAEAEAESYLAVRYATPVNLSAYPELADVLRAKVLDLAEYIAWRTSPFTSDMPARLTEVQRDALHWFRGVAIGQVALPAAGPVTGQVQSDDSPLYDGTARTFTHDELDGL